jgi:hypothetical protein
MSSIPTDRKGDWMQTYTGRQFWPVDPRPEEIFIEDIAHALSLACRYAGHCMRFYSVAEHSVLVSQNLPDHLKLWGLLHDASEAYLVDIPRPLKPFLTNYRELEDGVMEAVCKKFGLDYIADPFAMPSDVKAVDNRILHDEQAQIMAPSVAAWNLAGAPLNVDLHLWSPAEAEHQFLKTFLDLTE